MSEIFQHWGKKEKADGGGAVVRQTNICAVTGVPIVGGGITCRVAGRADLFYRVTTTGKRLLTDAKRKEIEAAIIAADASQPEKGKTASPPKIADTPAEAWEDPEKVNPKKKGD